jgi:hypothetical protein
LNAFFGTVTNLKKMITDKSITGIIDSKAEPKDKKQRIVEIQRTLVNRENEGKGDYTDNKTKN